MASGSASYAVSATNYGRNSADSYFVLSAPDVINGSLEVTGNLRVDGTSRLVGAVTCDGAVTAAGAVTAGSVSTAGNVNCAAVTASGAVNSATLSVSAASVLAGVTAQAVGCSSVTTTAAVNVGGQLSQATTSTIAVSGSGALSGTWNSTFQNVAGMRRTTWTLLNSPFASDTILNIPIVGNVASRIRLVCVNNGNTQSRSIMGEWTISPASGVFTNGTGYYTNYNMTANWVNSGTSTPLVLNVQLSGGGGGLVGTISIIAEQDVVVV